MHVLFLAAKTTVVMARLTVSDAAHRSFAESPAGSELYCGDIRMRSSACSNEGTSA